MNSNAHSQAIVDEVTEEMKVAMKAKETAKLNTIRLIRSAFTNAAIDLKTKKLSDEQVRSDVACASDRGDCSLTFSIIKAQTVLKKMAKMRKESIDMFEKGGATDRADAERAELQLIERWLPSMASEEQVREWVKEAIHEAGPNNMGKVMGALMKAHKAEVDGGMAQKIVKEELANLT